MKPTILVLTAALAAALAGCSTTPDKFTAADADQSGAITPSEFDTYMKQAVFEGIDANKDGGITMEEWRAANPSAPASRFKGADANGDGSITQAEGNAALDRKGSLHRLFKKIDADGDGSISRPEAEAFKAALSAQPGSTKFEQLSHAAK